MEFSIRLVFFEKILAEEHLHASCARCKWHSSDKFYVPRARIDPHTHNVTGVPVQINTELYRQFVRHRCNQFK